VTRTPPEYFEKLYGEQEDPWSMASSWYERRKYALTVASLPAERYRSAFEPGCSVGVLSEMLAPRCGQLLSADQAPVAVTAATRRLRPYPHARVEQLVIPEEWPSGPFDLLVLSEVGYYFDVAGLAELVGAAERSLAAGATIVAVHWTGQTDYPLEGAEVHRQLHAVPEFAPFASHVDDEFVLDVWQYRP
jgi:Nodulation protein S (NodS)